DGTENGSESEINDDIENGSESETIDGTENGSESEINDDIENGSESETIDGTENGSESEINDDIENGSESETNDDIENGSEPSEEVADEHSGMTICDGCLISYNGTETELVLPNDITSIGSGAFNGCSLKSITIPLSVTSISDDAFASCSDLVKITAPAEYMYLFSKENLLEVVITQGEIPENAFKNCTKLTSVEIKDGVTCIGSYAFYKCTELASVIISDSVTNIGYNAFTNCSKIEYVEYANAKYLGKHLIKAASTTISEIVVKADTASIAEGAFASCGSVTKITVEDGNSRYKSAGNCLIDTESKKLIAGCINSEIPSDGSVTEIAAFAFMGCSSLNAIKVPSSVTIIGDYAFYSCSGLEEITIADGVETIGNYAFYGCGNLTSISLPSSVKTIGNFSFYSCGLVDVTLINGITSIGNNAFADCENMESIIIPIGVKSIGRYAFYGCYNLSIYVREESQPGGWNSSWNVEECTVYFNYNN
ncbi:MAG: leucine-rich repeat protein, partial [Christensenellales bacterium]